MSNHSTLPTLNLQGLAGDLRVAVERLFSLVTLLENMKSCADQLIFDPQYSIPVGKPRNKAILLRDAVELAHNLADQWADELDVVDTEEWDAQLRDFADWQAKARAAISTLERLGYQFNGGVRWKPPLGNPPDYITNNAQPEINTQEASHG